MPDLTGVIEESRSLSIQERGKPSGISGGLSNVLTVPAIASAGQIIPPWWSTSRDKSLRNFWKRSDHLSGALYSMTSKMTAIPHKVVARDTSIKAHVEEAEIMTNVIQAAVEYGNGWVDFYSKFTEDLLCQDNGAFAEIIGPGPKNGPIVGRPVSVAHLDSSRCQRTGNSVYPVIYVDTDNKRYKLHYTRVMYTSQMTSPSAEMFGVGFCATSRCIAVAQTLIDILTYKMEKLGSRPHRELIITQGGLDPKDLQSAFILAESQMDSFGLTRYAKIVIGGSATMPEGKVQQVPLAELPDGFDEQSSITLGMATIALAFGVDARELFPAMTAGATRADALLQHIKQRGKGPGQILQVTEQLFNFKFLPMHLKFEFDFQDDAQDRQIAEIRKVRADRRVQDVASGAVNERTMRENMFTDGDINQSQFERMEMEAGRLPDGTPITSLFYKTNSDSSKYLDLGVDDPLDTDANEAEAMIKKIKKAEREAQAGMVNAISQDGKWAAMRAYYALVALEMEYMAVQEQEMMEEQAELAAEAGIAPQGAQGKPGQGNGKPTPNYVDPRTRKIDLTSPSKTDRTNAASSTGKPPSTSDDEE